MAVRSSIKRHICRAIDELEEAPTPPRHSQARARAIARTKLEEALLWLDGPPQLTDEVLGDPAVTGEGD